MNNNNDYIENSSNSNTEERTVKCNKETDSSEENNEPSSTKSLNETNARTKHSELENFKKSYESEEPENFEEIEEKLRRFNVEEETYDMYNNIKTSQLKSDLGCKASDRFTNSRLEAKYFKEAEDLHSLSEEQANRIINNIEAQREQFFSTTQDHMALTDMSIASSNAIEIIDFISKIQW